MSIYAFRVPNHTTMAVLDFEQNANFLLQSPSPLPSLTTANPYTKSATESSELHKVDMPPKSQRRKKR
jgi:hypothetical protein